MTRQSGETEPTARKIPAEQEAQHSAEISTADEPAVNELRKARLAAFEGPQQVSTSVLGKRTRDDQDKSASSKRPKDGASMNDAGHIASQSRPVFSVPSILGKRGLEDDVTASGSKQQKTTSA